MHILDFTSRSIDSVNDPNLKRFVVHYNKYWSMPEYEYEKLGRAERDRINGLIHASLDFLEVRFNAAGFDLTGLEVLLFIGKGTSNGHAWYDGKRWIVWLPIETYISKPRCEIFIAHELAHALQYRSQPGFYFEDHTTKDVLIRQLITEGLATYVTAKCLDISDNSALWADYISDERQEEWSRACWTCLSELSRKILDGIFDGAKLPHLFRADNPSDIEHYRAGYFVGLEAVKQIAEANSFTLPELIALKRPEFERLTTGMLESLC